MKKKKEEESTQVIVEIMIVSKQREHFSNLYNLTNFTSLNEQKMKKKSKKKSTCKNTHTERFNIRRLIQPLYQILFRTVKAPNIPDSNYNACHVGKEKSDDEQITHAKHSKLK